MAAEALSSFTAMLVLLTGAPVAGQAPMSPATAPATKAANITISTPHSEVLTDSGVLSTDNGIIIKEANSGASTKRSSVPESGTTDAQKVNGNTALKQLMAQVTSTTPSPAAPYVATSGDRIKDIALAFTGTAENSTTRWYDNFDFIKDIGDGAGYTTGIIGFTASSGGMLDVLNETNRLSPGNPMSKWIGPATQVRDSSNASAASATILGPAFINDWKKYANESWFRDAQTHVRDRTYWEPATRDAAADGLSGIGYVIMYDITVQHGRGGVDKIRREAARTTPPPSAGGKEYA